ncbi:MAG: VCBS domain-containing protein [Pseudomonadota bacterium]
MVQQSNSSTSGPALDLDYNDSVPNAAGTTSVQLDFGNTQPTIHNDGKTLEADGVAEMAVYSNVATVDGQSVDLIGYVISSEKLDGNGNPNGVDSNPGLVNTNPAASGGDGTANVKFSGNSAVEVRWVLVESGTETPVVVDSVSVLITDLDGNGAMTTYERVTVSKDEVDSYTLEGDPSNPTNVNVIDGGDSLTFQPNDEDPGWPGALPDNSVALTFTNTSEFTITYEKFNNGGNVGLDGTFDDDFFAAPDVVDTNPDHGALFTENGDPVALVDADRLHLDSGGAGLVGLTIRPDAATIEDGAEEVLIVIGDGGEEIVIPLDGSDDAPKSITVGGTAFDVTVSGGAIDIAPAAGTATDEAMEALLRGLRYEHRGDLPEGADPVIREMDITVTDANGATSSPATSTVQLVGLANDAPSITSTPADASGTAVEAGVDGPGIAAVGGTLTASDDGGAAALTWSGGTNGTYGVFSVDAATGAWTYVLDNARPQTEALAEGEVAVETFTVTVADADGMSRETEVTVTVEGTNDAPVITTDPAEAQGAVTEAGSTETGTPVATGQASASDVDTGAVLSWSGDADGTYGTFSIDADTGEWTYTLDDTRPQTQALSAGNHAVETFEITVTDEHGATDTQTITVRVNGAADEDTGVVMTEDVWFKSDSSPFVTGDDAKAEWTYHGGSEKLKLEIDIELEDLFGEDTTWTFDDVDVSEYLAIFDDLGARSMHKVDVDVKDDKISITLVARDLELTDTQFDALPDLVRTPIEVRNENGNVFCIDVNAQVNGGSMHSPIAFDLDGDGIISTTGPSTAENRVDDEIGDTVLFDIDGDGKLERIEWMDGQGDALLIDNRDGAAVGDMDGGRLFGDEGGTYADGYEKLALLDANEDGVLTGDELDGLELWFDDGDAILQVGETQTLAELGIDSVSVDGRIVFNEDGELLTQGEALQEEEEADPYDFDPETPGKSLVGGDGNDRLKGSTDGDRLDGRGGNDHLSGGKDGDLLIGGTGNDRLEGAKGDDVLDGGEGDDELRGGKDDDLLIGGEGDAELIGDTGDDDLRGGIGDDELRGGKNDDILDGGAGNDILKGDKGSDILDGGAGDDDLYGGKGPDTFVFSSGGGEDTVHDFDIRNDTLALDDDLWGGGMTGAQVLNAFGSVQDDDLVLEFDGGETLVLAGQADLSAGDWLDIV